VKSRISAFSSEDEIIATEGESRRVTASEVASIVILMTTERLEVHRTIPVAPSSIFRLLCDPKGHVAIDSSGMLMSADGDVATSVGDTFIVHMDREALNDYPLGLYDVTVTITTFIQDREIAWTVAGLVRPSIGHVYGYRLEAVDDATLVTSYYDWSDISPEWREANIFPVISESALRATLGILDRSVRGTDASTH
jgi:hypothetical protein